jgi:chromosomal replication initiation ATPase DnaA
VLPGLVGLKSLRVNTIKNIVLESLKVNWEDITSDTRTRPLPDARKILAYFIKKYYSSITVVEIGKLLNKDHSSVLYYLKNVEDLLLTDPQFSRKIKSIEFKLEQYNETI